MNLGECEHSVCSTADGFMEHLVSCMLTKEGNLMLKDRSSGMGKTVIKPFASPPLWMYQEIN